MPRTSGLQAPIMELTGESGEELNRGALLSVMAGHSGEVFAARFDPTGQLIASGSMDRTICRLPNFLGRVLAVLTCAQYYGGHTGTATTTAS